jgi:predicted nucleic acid-binding protein
MFTQEINKQNNLISVVLSTTINGIDIEEINIFTEEEWNKLNIMNKVFRKHQIDLEDMCYVLFKKELFLFE